MKNNAIFYSGRLALETAKDFLYFPLWWYSAGWWHWLGKVGNFITEWAVVLGVEVWIKNWFVPMYGQRDFASRLISFFIRSIQIIVRSIALSFFVVLGIIAALIWPLLPAAIIFAITLQFKS